MSKFLRKTLALALALTFVLSLGAAAAPASAVSVLLDGQPMSFTDAQPALKDGRVYVPYRAVFEALGAEVSYAASAKTVSAQRDGTAVVFAIGSNQVTVTENGKSQTIQVDAAPYIEEATGRTMVPVRFAAQSLGALVGWDKDTKTVNIIDQHKLEQTYSKKFTLLDRYSKEASALMGDSLSFSGKLNLELSVEEEGQVMPILMSGTISGGSNQQLANMKATFSLDLDKLLKELGSELDDEDKAQLELLKNIELNYIINLNTGMLYLNAPVLAQVDPSFKADTWFSVSINDFYKQTLGLDLDLKELMQNKQNVSICQAMLQGATATLDMDDLESYDQLVQALNTCEDLMGDKAFTKNGDTYTAKTSLSQNGAEITFQIDLKETQGKLGGITVNLTAKDDEANMVMTVKQDTKNTSMTFQFKMDEVTMNCDYSIQYSPLKDKLNEAPPAGADVQDLMKLVGPTVTMTNEKVTAR